jgi:hypothetical protein
LSLKCACVRSPGQLEYSSATRASPAPRTGQSCQAARNPAGAVYLCWRASKTTEETRRCDSRRSCPCGLCDRGFGWDECRGEVDVVDASESLPSNQLGDASHVHGHSRLTCGALSTMQMFCVRACGACVRCVRCARSTLFEAGAKEVLLVGYIMLCWFCILRTTAHRVVLPVRVPA